MAICSRMMTGEYATCPIPLHNVSQRDVDNLRSPVHQKMIAGFSSPKPLWQPITPCQRRAEHTGHYARAIRTPAECRSHNPSCTLRVPFQTHMMGNGSTSPLKFAAHHPDHQPDEVRHHFFYIELQVVPIHRWAECDVDALNADVPITADHIHCLLH